MLFRVLHSQKTKERDLFMHRSYQLIKLQFMINNYNLYFSILSAGKGTRMNSTKPKVMQEIAGIPMLEILINSIKKIDGRNINIITSQDDHLNLKKYFDNLSLKNLSYIIQKDRLGTAHAVKTFFEQKKSLQDGILIVLYGDTPFVSQKTIKKLIKKIAEKEAKIIIAAFISNKENQYGRLITDKENILKIVEYKEANEQERQIKLCNSGIMAFDLATAKKLIPQINNNNSKKEYYLTDIVELANKNNDKVQYITTLEDEVQGVNNKVELAKANQYYFQQKREESLLSGVTMIDPQSVFIYNNVTFGKDVTIEPNVIIKENVNIADNAHIKSFSYIENSDIGKNVVVGPYARIRPKTTLEDNVKIGNFVEIKNSTIKNSSKVNHLSYVGDSILGKNVNIGAGTITCNYDGYKKHKTIIGDNVFVGSNSCFIAPITIEENSLIAAGSVINKKVAKNSLAIARTKQKNIENGAKKYKTKN